MKAIRGIYDGKSLKLLEPINLDKPHWVEVTLREEVKPDELERARRRERILSYAGMWLDLPAEVWSTLSEVIGRRPDFFPARNVTW
jgi:hypothetical protein